MKFKFSIRKKTIVLIILMAMMLSAVSMLVCSSVISSITDELYRSEATELVDTVAQIIDVDQFVRVRDSVLSIYKATPLDQRVDSENYDGREEDFENYIAQFERVPDSSDFNDLVLFLRKIQNVNNVDCIYTTYVDAENRMMVYIVDAAEEDACDPGTLDPIYETNEPLLSNPELGFPAYITDTDAYGWLVTAGAPLHDSDGNVVGYVMTDISMEYVRYRQIGYVMRLLTFLIITVAIICVLGVIIVNFTLIKPISLLTKTARSYYEIDNTDDDGEDYRKELRKHKKQQVFSKLKIRTGDEIEELVKSMMKMENDINDHINSLISMDSELTESKHHANELAELANKDSLTGLRNKTAYDNEILKLEQRIAKGEAEFGIVVVDLNDLKKINDTYGHESGNAAIISIGKILSRIFVHSTVFRIGGDEFAVIIKHNDYEKIEDLTKEFKDAISAVSRDASLEKYERVSAAIGYALYSSDIDSDAVDVFRRADNEMYICKRNLKENNDQ